MTVPADRLIIASYSDLSQSAGPPRVGIGLYHYGSPTASVGAGYTLDITYRGGGGAPITLSKPILGQVWGGTEYIIIESTWYDFFDVVPDASYYNDDALISAGDIKPDVIALVLKKDGVAVDTLGNPGGSTPLLNDAGVVVRNTNFAAPGGGYLASDWNFLATNDPSLGGNPYKYVTGFTGAVTAIDTVSPTVSSIVRTEADVPTSADTITYTVTFSEQVTGVSADDFTLTSTGTASGQVTAVTLVGTAAYVITVSNVTGYGTLRLDLKGSGTGIVDAHGNAIAGGYTTGQAYTVDTMAPTLSITSDRAALKAGETATITFTFSEDPGETFTSADITVTGGTLSAISGTGTTRIAVFTPTANTDSGVAGITVTSGAYTDSAGNGGGAGATPSLQFDTRAPTVTISSDRSALNAGETATITFTFSEDPGNTFTWDGSVGDIVVTGGTLSAISGSGLTRTAVFTPNAGTDGGSASITVPAGSYTDTAGNSGGAGATPSLTFDTIPPDAPSLSLALDTGASAADGITSNGTIVVTGLEADARGWEYSLDGGLSWTDGAGTTFTLASGTYAAGQVMVRQIDAAGNIGTPSGSLSAITFDTTAPTVTITSNVDKLKTGETATITFTFSEDPGATFTLADITVTGGTLGALSGTGSTRTAVFTPTAGVSNGVASITVVGGAYADAAGNSGGAGATPALTFSTTPTQMIDGVAVDRTETVNHDNSVSQVVVIPVVTAARNESTGNPGLADIPLVSAGGSPVLLAQLPVGFGLQASGPAAPTTAGTALTDLIREIRAHTAAGSADQNRMTGGSSAFLDGLSANTPLLVQTIVPSVLGPTAPGQPLVISGSPPAPAAPMTALVIDGSGLPAGTHLQLDNVNFAAVIGSVRVTGGAGSQTVFADGASQHLFLGADDDELHGGGGNDYVGSQGGNDRLYGDDGNDTVSGGIGHDSLWGGNGNDRLVGGTGNDQLDGGAGKDRLYGEAGNDRLLGGAGNDSLWGGSGHDKLSGGSGNDALSGGAGKDLLYGEAGNDTLKGEAGNDWIVGGLGRDQLWGGSGADTFAFHSVQESRAGSQRDVIHDFQSGSDKIDLRKIDADTTQKGNQAFSWTSVEGPGPFLHPHETGDFLSSGFTGRAGELRYERGILMGDVNGDGQADFEIRIVGPFSKGDVIL